MAKKRRVTVAEFEAQAAATDQLNPDDSETPLLGLVGEVGSLVSALKKKRRDTDAFFGYHEAVVEELGDVLWYISRVAWHGGTPLAEDPSPLRRKDAAAEGARFFSSCSVANP